MQGLGMAMQGLGMARLGSRDGLQSCGYSDGLQSWGHSDELQSCGHSDGLQSWVCDETPYDEPPCDEAPCDEPPCDERPVVRCSWCASMVSKGHTRRLSRQVTKPTPIVPFHMMSLPQERKPTSIDGTMDTPLHQTCPLHAGDTPLPPRWHHGSPQ